ncbi:MAG: hypothetical protein QG597_4886 [Actinomycetota bacterium]|nr:hypothetical protein [Actinomycetota bacterium]
MLVSFEVANYGPFHALASLTLPLPKSTDAPSVATPLGERLPQVAMIFGPNASGKTSFLDAIVALSTAVEQSHRMWDPGGGTNARPFLLQSGAPETVTTWRVVFIADDDAGQPGQYEYSVTMDSSAVRGEALRFKSAATRRYRTLFSRKRQLVNARSKALSGLAAQMRENSLLLSVAAQANQSVVMPAYRWLTHGLLRARGLGRPEVHQHALNELISSANLPLVRELVARADLGITDVRGEAMTDERLKEIRAIGRTLQEAVLGVRFDVPTGEFASLAFGHTGAGGETYYLPESLESEGTRAFIVAGLLAAQALHTGGVVILDELDGSLHPTLVDDLVAQFRSPLTNPRGAQLIASTHDTHQMGRNALEPLSRHEVWFTQKDAAGASTLFRLSDFGGIRPDVDQEHRYLAGVFGALPQPTLSASEFDGR